MGNYFKELLKNTEYAAHFLRYFSRTIDPISIFYFSDKVVIVIV